VPPCSLMSVLGGSCLTLNGIFVIQIRGWSLEGPFLSALLRRSAYGSCLWAIGFRDKLRKRLDAVLRFLGLLWLCLPPKMDFLFGGMYLMWLAVLAVVSSLVFGVLQLDTLGAATWQESRPSCAACWPVGAWWFIPMFVFCQRAVAT